MKFKGYHHVGLAVNDMEKSLDFYTKGLGGTIIHSFTMANTDKLIYLVDLGGNAVVELLPRGYEDEEANARWAHIALLTDDTRTAYDLMLKAGAKPRTEPMESITETSYKCNAFVFGPDGEIIELFQTERK